MKMNERLAARSTNFYNNPNKVKKMIDTLALIYTPSIVDGYINLMSEIGAKINIDLKK